MDKTGGKGRQRDKLSAVSVAQVILSLLLILSVLITSKSGAAKALKSDIERLMSWNTITLNAESVSAFARGIFSRGDDDIHLASDADTACDTDAASGDDTTSDTDTAFDTTGDSDTTASDFVTDAELEVKLTMLGASGMRSELMLRAESSQPAQTVMAPLESGKYTSYFGSRINPITGVTALHTGLDIAAPTGTKIRAALSGTVRKVGEDSRSGKYIYLTHENGLETLYCHCSKIIASQGANIRQGETIALVGSTGWSTGPHLHFEIHKNGQRVDPLLYLSNADG